MGGLLEFFVVESREKFEVLLYKNYNAALLLNENLFIDTDFTDFWRKFLEIEKIEEKLISHKNPVNELYLFINDVFGEIKNTSRKIERYVKPRFLWPTHRKLWSII